jgi:hypothetical protein
MWAMSGDLGHVAGGMRLVPCIEGRLAATVRIGKDSHTRSIAENPKVERRVMENENFYTYLLHATAGFGVKRYDGVNLRAEFTLEETPWSGVYKQRRWHNNQAFNVPDDLRFVNVGNDPQPSTSGTIAHTPQLRSRFGKHFSAPSCLHCALALTPTSFASFVSRRAGFFQRAE